jgi:hypothetical protein
LLTRDNLVKRQNVDDLTCIFLMKLNHVSIFSLNVWLLPISRRK